MHTTCVHVPHTHIWRSAKLSDQTHKRWIHPHYLRKPGNLFLCKALAQDNFHSKVNTTPLQWNCITAKAANNFRLTFYSTHATSNRFWVSPQAPQPFIYPFVYQPTCTTLGLTRARNQTNRMNGVDSTSLRGGPEWLTHWVCYPVCQRPIPEMNTRHHANHALSRICETKCDTIYTSGPLCSTIKQRGVCHHWRLIVYGGLQGIY